MYRYTNRPLFLFDIPHQGIFTHKFPYWYVIYTIYTISLISSMLYTMYTSYIHYIYTLSLISSMLYTMHTSYIHHMYIYSITDIYYAIGTLPIKLEFLSALEEFHIYGNSLSGM